MSDRVRYNKEGDRNGEPEVYFLDDAARFPPFSDISAERMMEHLSTNNAVISFLDIGSGPAILLVHGFPLDHSMWQHQIEPLSRSHRVICPDLPGFGRSKLTGEIGAHPVSMKQFADSLVFLLDQLKIDRVTFCGLSMGGYIGWQFWKHHANRLEQLIVCDSRAAADTDAVARGRRLIAQSVRKNGIGSLANDMIPKLFFAENLDARASEVASIRRVVSQTNAEAVAQSQIAMAERPDVTNWLSEIEVPTLFVVGEHDQITPPEEMRANCDLVAGARMVEISHAGHLAPLENPVEFNQAVLRFL